MNMGKKGDIEIRTVVIFIIAIIGFLVVLFFFVIFKGSLDTYDEACKFSVLSRAQTHQATNGYIPLKCTTKKICLKDGSGKCEDSFAGENNVAVESLPTDEEKAVERIEEVSAKAMYDCWKMMGEGKIDIFNGGFAKYLGLSENKVSCTICSRIAYNTKETTLNKVDISSYLRRAKVPNSELSYLQVFTDKSVESYPEVNWDSVYNSATSGTISKEHQTYEISGSSTKQYAVVFTQVKSQGYMETLGNLGKVGVLSIAGSLLVAPKATLKTAGFIARGGVYSIVLFGVGAAGVSIYSMSNVHAGKVATATYCGKISGADGETLDRCSGISIVPYNSQSINQICQAMEGNP